MTEYQEPRDVGPAVGGHLRITTAERTAAAELLRQARNDGRLQDVEYQQRHQAVQQAVIRDDLTPLLRDLTPVPGAPSAIVPAVSNQTPARVNGGSALAFALLSTCRRVGRWKAPGGLWSVGILGEILLDFTDVEWPDSEITVSCALLLGEVKIVVPADVEVVCQVVPVLGEVKFKGASGPPSGRRLRLLGGAVLGTVKIEYV